MCGTAEGNLTTGMSRRPSFGKKEAKDPSEWTKIKTESESKESIANFLALGCDCVLDDNAFGSTTKFVRVLLSPIAYHPNMG
jgi:hypothetical protein